MVIAGIGALASLGLALPTGLAFGYGYGYGVRQGYHAFRPSKSSVTKDLHLSANPITGAKGAGLLSAEEMTSKQASKVQPQLTSPSIPQQESIKLVSSPEPIKRAEKGHQGNYATDLQHMKSKYGDTRWFRTEAGAVVDQIDKEHARRLWRKHGMKGGDREIRRAFIKKQYPFNKGYTPRR